MFRLVEPREVRMFSDQFATARRRARRLPHVLGELRHRALSRTGFADSDAKIAADAQGYWRTAQDDLWRCDSHWRDASVFQGRDVWDRIGRQQLALFERGARTVQFDRPLDRVVDWGCGGGSTAVHFAPKAGRYIGVDVSADSLAECGKQIGEVCDTPFQPVRIEVSDPEAALAEISGPADLFLSFYVFELIPTPEYGARILHVAEQVLAPGGIALIQVKYRTGSWRTLPRGRDYTSGLANMTTYRIEEFWTLAHDCGLQPETVTLEPKNPLDERYAYFLLSKPAG
jgi:SAM-dependent methyltransferase